MHFVFCLGVFCFAGVAAAVVVVAAVAATTTDVFD